MDGFAVLETIITAGALASLVLEAIKFLIRRFKGDPEYDFSKRFYTFIIPVLTFAVRPVLAVLGVGDFEMPPDLLIWIKELVVIALSSLAAVFSYNQGIKPLKDYEPEN